MPSYNDRDMNPRISVTAPVSAAWNQTWKVLTGPFDPQKWLILGFLAFLQSLGGGCDGTNVNINLPMDQSDEWNELIRHVLRFISGHVPIVIGVGAILLLFGFALFVLFHWLSARGCFAYLSCIVNNRAEVSRPWGLFAKEADSFFIVRFVFSLGSVIIVIALCFPFLAVLWDMFQRGEDISFFAVFFETGAAVWLIPLIPALLVITIVQGILIDFVVPIQFMKHESCFVALKIALRLVFGNLGAFVKYAIMKLLLALASILLLLMACCLTVCLLLCCMIIPVVGQAILQPLFVFFRAYSIYFLAQFGDDFNCFYLRDHDSGDSALQPAGGLPV